MRLQGKIALVTGGTSGIGRQIVRRFVQEGATVTFSGRRVSLGEEVARLSGAMFIQADVALESDAERCIESIAAQHGRLDVLINNAGGPGPGGRLQDLPLAGFDAAIAVHLRGTVAHMKHAATLMRGQKQGSIINIASVAGHRAGYSSSMMYSVAKAAVIHLSRCAALELGEDGVRVNSISPGIVATGLFAKAAGIDSTAADAMADQVKAIAKLQPLPHAGLADDIANAALYLASDEAAFVNGADLVVDGGLIRGRRYSEATASAQAWKAMFEQTGDSHDAI